MRQERCGLLGEKGDLVGRGAFIEKGECSFVGGGRRPGGPGSFCLRKERCSLFGIGEVQAWGWGRGPGGTGSFLFEKGGMQLV